MKTYINRANAVKAADAMQSDHNYVIVVLENGRFVPMFFTGWENTQEAINMAHDGAAAIPASCPLGFVPGSHFYAGGE